jgi:hypothetical protein
LLFLETYGSRAHSHLPPHTNSRAHTRGENEGQSIKRGEERGNKRVEKGKEGAIEHIRKKGNKDQARKHCDVPHEAALLNSNVILMEENDDKIMSVIVSSSSDMNERKRKTIPTLPPRGTLLPS